MLEKKLSVNLDSYFNNFFKFLPEIIPLEKPSLIHGDLWNRCSLRKEIDFSRLQNNKVKPCRRKKIPILDRISHGDNYFLLLIKKKKEGPKTLVFT